MAKDKRPDPRPRKNPQLWQAYLMWDELVQLRKRHVLRIKSIRKGKSNMDLDFEIQYLKALGIGKSINRRNRIMIEHGKRLGPVWDWITTIKGMASGSLPAQLLAQIDDIGRFDTISKLWAFSGWAVRDGQIDRCKKGKKAPYNRRLKSTVWLCVDQFVRQNTPLYRELYDEEKERQLEMHPVPICKKCGGEAVQVGIKWKCGECGQRNEERMISWTPGHLDARAKRKVAKIFLQHVWLVWRQCEELPISEPWVIAHGGHVDYIPPPNLPPEGVVVKVL